MSATTKIDTGLEKLREALAKADHLDLPYHEDDVNMLLRTIQVSTRRNYGQSKELAQLMRVGYRSRDAEIQQLKTELAMAMDAAAKGDLARQAAGGMEMELAAKDAEIAELVEALELAITDIHQHLQVAKYNLRGEVVGGYVEKPERAQLIHEKGIKASEDVIEHARTILAKHGKGIA